MQYIPNSFIRYFKRIDLPVFYTSKFYHTINQFKYHLSDNHSHDFISKESQSSLDYHNFNINNNTNDSNEMSIYKQPYRFQHHILPPSVVYVKAYFIARAIDILKVDTNVYGSSKHAYQSNHVTLNLNNELNQHISVFKFGAVVFFNIPDVQHLEHLRSIKEKGLPAISMNNPSIDDERVFTETYKIIIHENLEKPSVIKAEHLNIQNLDAKNLVIVSTVMAQTVALDYYAMLVDDMIKRFMDMNYRIESTGKFSEQPQQLYQLIASNNVVITTVLSKLGIFEGMDAAWDNADYHYTWESLRKDFELEYRFRDLSMKLELVKEDTRFFLEMLHNKKTTRMEWIIVILIGLELITNIWFHFSPLLNS